MVMLRPDGKPYKIAKNVMKQQGVNVRPPSTKETMKVKGPYLQH